MPNQLSSGKFGGKRACGRWRGWPQASANQQKSRLQLFENQIEQTILLVGAHFFYDKQAQTIIQIKMANELFMTPNKSCFRISSEMRRPSELSRVFFLAKDQLELDLASCPVSRFCRFRVNASRLVLTKTCPFLGRK